MSTANPPRTLPRIMPVVRAESILSGDAVAVCVSADSEAAEEKDGWMGSPVLAWAVEEGTAVVSVGR